MRMLRASPVLFVALAAGSSGAFAADVTVPDGGTVSKGNASTAITGSDKVTVGVNGTLTSSANPTISQTGSAAGILIDNKGLIESTGAGARAIRFSGGANTVIDIRNGTGATIRSDNDAININNSTTSGTINVTNDGLIESRGVNGQNGQAIDFNNVGGNARVTITNTVNGILRAADSDAVRPGDGGVVRNYGQIIGNNYQTNSGADGIDYQNSRSGTVYNYATGLISGGRHGINIGYDSAKNAVTDAVTVYNYGNIIGRNGSGVGSDVSGAVYNWGRITGTADRIAGVANGDGDGVDIDYKATIVNYGIIEGTGAKGVGSDGLTNTSEGVAVGGGSIDNKAGARISGLANGILVDNSSQGNAFYKVEITNAGIIEGTTGYGIFIRSTFDNVVTNAGTISGGNGTAIQFGSGNDTLNILTGSVINGVVDGGAGVDTVNLSGSGVFAGTVNFEKLNVLDGRWVLTGNESYSQGATVFSGATLVEMGTLKAAISVQAGGTLAGTGSVGALSLAGDVAPGETSGAIGTLTVNGNAAFAPTSRFLVDVTPQGTADKLLVTGTAALAGTVVVSAQAGAWSPLFRATILQATAGISGRFDSVTTNLAFLSAALSYTANSVDLALARNDVRFQDVAANANQIGVATALNTLPRNTPITDALLGQSAAGAQQAYSALSGDGLTGALTGATQTSSLFGAGVMSQIVPPDAGVAPPSASASGAGGPMALGMNGARRDGSSADLATPSRLRLWASGFNQAARLGGETDVGAPTVTSRISGIMVGADWRASPNATLGLTSGYSDGSTWAGDRQTSISASGYHVGTYGVARFGGFYLAGLASASGFDNVSKRTVEALGAREMERASFGSSAIALRGEAGYTFKTAMADITPFAALSFSRTFSEGFQETAMTPVTALGPLGLAVAGARADAMPLTLGVRLGRTVQHPAGWTLRPSASLAWVHTFATDQPRLDARLSAVPDTAFTVAGARLDADVLQAKAGLAVAFAPGVELAGELATEQGARTQSLTASGQVRISW